MKKYLAVLLCFLLLSCSVQKRRYQPGYYIGWKHANNKPILKTEDVSLKNNLKEKITLYETVVQKNKATELNSSPNLKQTIKPAPNDTCDIIIFKDGSEVQGKVIEINPTQIKYKRCDLLNGPLYTVKKSEVFMIKYVGGAREVIKDETPANVMPPTDKPVYNQPNHPTTTNVPLTNKQSTHPKAIKAFVFGLLSFLSFLLIGTLGIYAFLFSIFAAIRSIAAWVDTSKAIKNYPTEYKGAGLAAVGGVFSIIVLLIIVALIIYVLSMI